MTYNIQNRKSGAENYIFQNIEEMKESVIKNQIA